MDDLQLLAKPTLGVGFRHPMSWSQSVVDRPSDVRTTGKPCSIGVLKGEGVGPEVVGAALQVLAALEQECASVFSVSFGGSIGMESERESGKALSGAVTQFCADIFAKGGAILAGPGGGRFVYDMRRRFDLFCKISPLAAHGVLRNAGRMKAQQGAQIDILVVRENAAGIYQGEWTETRGANNERIALHRFSYSESEVRRILEVAARISRQRRGELVVVTKPSGIPTVSRLWLDVAEQVSQDFGIKIVPMEVDYAAYYLVQHAQSLDVVVTPNLFGDVISDIGGVLVGSRGLCYSGNFSGQGYGVYQTNHGAAHDLAGTDRANPAGQIFSLAMMLRESFGLVEEATLIERAVVETWRQGWRTADLAERGCRVIGTREMADRICESLHVVSESL